MTNPYPQYPEHQGQQPPYGGSPYPGAPYPGQYYGGQPQTPPPENNLVWAILATVLCCMPLGIVAIVKSSQVNSLWFQGFHAEAYKAGDEAKKWAMWSAIAAGSLIVLYILFIVIMIVAVGAEFSHLVPG